MEEVVIATGSYDGSIKLWRPTSESALRTLNFGKVANGLALSADRKVLLAAGFSATTVYDLGSAGRDPVAAFDGHLSNVTGCCFLQGDSTVASVGEDGRLLLFDTRGGKQTSCIVHDAALNTLSVACDRGDAALLVTGDQEGRLLAYDLRQPRHPFATTVAFECDVGVRSVSCAPGAQILACSDGRGIVRVYAYKGSSHFFAPQQSIQAHLDAVMHVNLSPDGAVLATCSADKTCKIWSVALDEDCYLTRARVLGTNEATVWASAFSADSACIITAADKSAKLWNIAGDPTDKYVYAYNGHSHTVTTVVLGDVRLPL